jgi:hypothetical protein
MMNTITTPNMLEVAFLLDRHHTITTVSTQTAWPYGIEELAVTLSGENIDLDHANFLRHGKVSLSKIPLAFDSILIAIYHKVQQGEA